MKDTSEQLLIPALFNAASALAPSERGAFLDHHCPAGSPGRTELDSLLAHHERLDDFLERTPHVARDILNALSLASPYRIEPGAVIGRYSILGLIGEGGMGVVYRARQENPAREVALKVMRPGLATPATLRRFRHEAEALGALQHVGIAAIFEAGTAEVGGIAACPFVAMEYVRGRPLAQFVEQENLDAPARLELLARIADAVHHAHERGLIHRDLKPANILVDATGQPKVLDFGVAHVAEPDAHAATLTGAGQLIGTLAFMSPEQVRGDRRQIDARSDVYALGVILYELLAGRPPHDITGVVSPEALRIICDESPIRLGSVCRAYRGDIETIVERALDKDRDRRYPSAAALADDIRRFLRDEPIIARPASTAYRCRKFARRHKTLVGITCGVFVSLALGSAGMGLLLLRALDAEKEAQAKSVESQRAARAAIQYGRFLDRMLASAEQSVSEGRDISMLREMLDRGVLDAETALANEPEVRAGVRLTLGSTYQSLGLYDRAEPLMLASLAERRALYPGDHADVASSLASLGWLWNDMGSHAAAEGPFREVLAMRTRLFGPGDPVTLDSADSLARCLAEPGNPLQLEEAGRLCRDSLAIRRGRPESEGPQLAACLLTLSLVMRKEHDLAGAEAALREAMELLRRADGESSTRIAGVQISLGRLLHQRGDLPNAEKELREGLTARRRLLGARHPALTSAQLWLSAVLTDLGQHAESEALCREALDIRTSALGPDHPQVTEAMKRLGDALAGHADPDAARRLYHRVLARLVEHPDLAGTLAQECREQLESLPAAP